MNVSEALRIFGLYSTKDIDHKELKSRYRKLVKKYHPDINNNIGDDKIKDVISAYEILNNASVPIVYGNSKIVEFDELIESFKNHTASKYNKDWTVRFKIKISAYGTVYTAVATDTKNNRDEYSINIETPFEIGDNIKIDFYGLQRELKLTSNMNMIFINYKYLAKVNLNFMHMV